MNDGGAGIGALADSLMAWGQNKMNDDRAAKNRDAEYARQDARSRDKALEDFHNEDNIVEGEDGTYHKQLKDKDGQVISDITLSGMAADKIRDEKEGLINSRMKNESDKRKLLAEKADFENFIADGGDEADFVEYQAQKKYEFATDLAAGRKQTFISKGLQRDPTATKSSNGNSPKGLSATPAEKKFAIALASGSDKSTYATNGVDRLGANDILLSMYPDEPGIKLRELQKRQAAGDPKAIAFWNALAKKKAKAGKVVSGAGERVGDSLLNRNKK